LGFILFAVYKFEWLVNLLFVSFSFKRMLNRG